MKAYQCDVKYNISNDVRATTLVDSQDHYWMIATILVFDLVIALMVLDTDNWFVSILVVR